MKTLVAATLALTVTVVPALAQKTGRYSPAIERAYAAVGVTGIVDKTCQKYLTVNMPAVTALQDKAGLAKTNALILRP